ncbi:MAG: hypothetical protein JF887_08240 [Candidatus Dormibacteraeota bacterium]|uniref:Uncharacterized protein n=1 Tax=Candidatus Amunia macphersoniae TaxID=3127014 RepID=A0A934KPB7_9BACT|nr:hypothetical protein [Candidatus Dormibacteraeota bacterium]
MPFSFAGPTLPMTVRACRSLVWTQAAFVILAGIFVVMASTVFGSSNSIPFGSGTLSGGSAAGLGIAYVLAGMTLAYLGVELGRLAPWSRTVLVGVQAFLTLLLLVRSFDVSVSTVINLLLCGAIIALLFAPDTRRALAGATGPATVAQPTDGRAGSEVASPGAIPGS